MFCAIRATKQGVFGLAAAGVFVAAKCQKFLEELHLVGLERTGFDFLAVILRPLCWTPHNAQESKARFSTTCLSGR